MLVRDTGIEPGAQVVELADIDGAGRHGGGGSRSGVLSVVSNCGILPQLFADTRPPDFEGHARGIRSLDRWSKTGLDLLKLSVPPAVPPAGFEPATPALGEPASPPSSGRKRRPEQPI